VFCMVLVGTLVGLIGLFTVHSAYWGLGIIFFGPPVVRFLTGPLANLFYTCIYQGCV
jgi:hypothetical protein